MAMVASGPMPGSTPISVPSRQPTKAYIRFTGVKATPKPSARWLNNSMLIHHQKHGPDWQLQLEQQYKSQVTQGGQRGGQQRRFLKLETLAGQAGNKGQQVNTRHQAQRGQFQARQATQRHAKQQVGRN